MNTVRNIQKLNKRELEEGITPEGSWHTDYRDTAFIYVGGLPFELSEGDIITMFSQFGEPVWVRLARDKETGKSRGFCWLKYEDQRSTDLAVDNLGGATVMGRVLRVDHTRYKPKDDEDMGDNTMGDVKRSEDEGEGCRKKQRTQSESDGERPLLPEEIELAKLMRDHDEDDPMKAYMIEKKKEEVEAALKKWRKNKKKERKHHHSRRHHRDDSRDRERDRRRIKAGDDESDYSRPKCRDDSRDRERRRDGDHYRSRERRRDSRDRRRRTSTSPDSSGDDRRRRYDNSDSADGHKRRQR
ncbi:RNA-binding domain-containing protein [Zopfia rhizophila CBS 207.26]|uniref:RNA-binding domain-containing protein n=1 Tax=Zopfia rhizophila CBS 207.26 TaxID=1314779 RepID=A0A6A6D8L3_9PEZI|nr:RNA-binding domain-containing protein [Zopfia rhizophila CBS 207.26]